MSDTIYCYPDSDVLVNKLDIRENNKLHVFERKLTMLRLIKNQLPCGRLDLSYGLVAIDPRRDRDALYVSWMVETPHNNPEICGIENKKFLGVGGHLFAIAIMKSVEYGMGGAVFGFASN